MKSKIWSDITIKLPSLTGLTPVENANASAAPEYETWTAGIRGKTTYYRCHYAVQNAEQTLDHKIGNPFVLRVRTVTRTKLPCRKWCRRKQSVAT